MYTPDLHHRPSYQLHDDPIPADDDAGDIPLLRRDSSGSAMQLSMPMPGGFQPGHDDDDDEAMNNIRYGRIPQRVPRRYKTLKKVECVLIQFLHSMSKC